MPDDNQLNVPPALEASVSKRKNITAPKATAKRKRNEPTQESADVDEVDEDVDIQGPSKSKSIDELLESSEDDNLSEGTNFSL